jgi:hypothetical protein
MCFVVLGTQFASFTSTKVQILTPEELCTDAEKPENSKLVDLFRVDAIPHFAFIRYTKSC